MEHPLGKITAQSDAPCGPDAVLDIVVDRQWLKDGKTIEIDLPRHLICAACQGAGCDVCDQSGAITVRERSELAEVLRVTLPRQEIESEDLANTPRSLALKVPGFGGLANGPSPSTLRGRLLIRIGTSGPISSCIRAVVDGTPESIQQTTKTPAPAKLNAAALSPSAMAPTWTALDTTRTADDSEPRTRRSVAPAVMQKSRSLAARAAKTAVVPVEPSIGWTWRDALIGVTILTLGLILAWLLF